MPTGLQEPKKRRFADFLSNRLVVKFLPLNPRPKRPADLEIVVYTLPGMALVPVFRFVKYWLLSTGNKFSNPNRLLQSKQC